MWPFVFSALTKAAGSALDVVGSFKEASADRAYGNAEQAIYGQDANLARQRAADAIALGQEAANRQTYKMRTLTGSQASAFAGQGVNVKTGSAAAVTRGDRSLGAADRAAIIENAAREAAGFNAQASIFTAQGNLAWQASRNKAMSADISAIGSLVNFGGDMVNFYDVATK